MMCSECICQSNVDEVILEQWSPKYVAVMYIGKNNN